MTTALGPPRWAIEITKMLNQVFGPEHFPVDVVAIARDYTAQRFPGDAITLAEGAGLPGFDGALYRAPAGKSGWGIVYNNVLRLAGPHQFHPGPRIRALSSCTAPITRTAFAAASRMSSGGIRPMGKSSTRRTSSPRRS